VIGRNTAFTYKGKHVDLKQIGRELNVRYVLEGSVQRSSNRLRVNVQLIDAESGMHLWAERFDKPVADLFDVQDEIVARLANQLRAQLIVAEARRAERAPHPDSMDLYFQGMASLNKGTTPQHVVRASNLFEQALADDPNNVNALVGSAYADSLRAMMSLANERAALHARAESTVKKALSLAPEHVRGHLGLAIAQICTNRALQGIAECEQALLLDRNLASAHVFTGMAKLLIGRGEEAEVHINEAFRLSPRDTNGYLWMAHAGYAKLLIGKDDDAVGLLRRAIESNRNFPPAHFYLGAALAHLGQNEDARAAIQEGRALNPSYTVTHHVDFAISKNQVYLAQRERVL
jgi:tetratricopeptide (TPR) repeat protein